MQYEQLAMIHFVTIFPAFLIGTWLLVRPKGTPNHRLLGKIYMVLVLFSVVVSLWMPARVGPAFLGHFGFIHGLSVMAVVSVVVAWRAIKVGNIKRHKGAMVGLYAGGMLIAGGFTLMPGRMLHAWLFG